MSVRTTGRDGLKLIVSGAQNRRARHQVHKLLAARPSLPNHFRAAIYFSDAPINLYQIRQWYEPMRRLAETHPVVVIVRSARAFLALDAECPLPLLFAPMVSQTEAFVADQPLRAVFYVNQNTRNFQMIRAAKPAHVFINHGESDKAYMASNQLKAYDFSFVAGDAAIKRVSQALVGYDVARLRRIGRPQADVHYVGPTLPQDDREVVLYAPTWEGDRPSMCYSSLASHGPALVRSLVASGRHRLIYRPHPRTGIYDPRFSAVHDEIARLIKEANRKDPAAGHLIDMGSAFGWQLQSADTCVCDISAVAFDWLATAKPLLLTRPVTPHAVVDESGIAGSLPLLEAAAAPGVIADLDACQDATHAASRAELAQQYFGDTTPGAGMQAFLAAADAVIVQREQELSGRSHRVDVAPADDDTDIENGFGLEGDDQLSDGESAG